MNKDTGLYVGIMSGTSTDGADAILADFSTPQPTVRAFSSEPYTPALRAALLALNQPGDSEIERSHLAANQLAAIYARATARALAEAHVSPRDVVAVGCHGQTIRHRPDLGFTTQLNNGPLLAELTGIDVVTDFRTRDIAAGGQGAPLAPAFHDGMFRAGNETRIVANIGGIANLTILEPGRPVWGFDCGPGNCLMDDWIALHHGRDFDDNGNWAAQGQVVPALLDRLRNDPYFTLPPPKSTGRDLFNLAWLRRVQRDETPVDVQATLLELTAQTMADHVHRAAPRAAALIVCGGGANNGTLMARLATLLPATRIETTDRYGVPTQQVEALAFAWFAKCCVEGTSLDLTRITGASHSTKIGTLHRA